MYIYICIYIFINDTGNYIPYLEVQAGVETIAITIGFFNPHNLGYGAPRPWNYSPTSQRSQRHGIVANGTLGIPWNFRVKSPHHAKIAPFFEVLGGSRCTQLTRVY